MSTLPLISLLIGLAAQCQENSTVRGIDATEMLEYPNIGHTIAFEVPESVVMTFTIDESGSPTGIEFVCYDSRPSARMAYAFLSRAKVKSGAQWTKGDLYQIRIYFCTFDGSCRPEESEKNSGDVEDN